MNGKYNPVSSASPNVMDESNDLEATGMLSATEKSLRHAERHTYRYVLHWVIHAISAITLMWILLRPVSSPDSMVYTPANKYIESSTHREIFLNSFWHPSPYKGPPTKGVLSKWDHITETGPLNITADEMARMGHSLDAVQYPPEIGGGYLAYLESAHQLHCLQALWEDHHFAKFPEMFPMLAEKKAADPEIDEWHFEHCVDVIRNQIMCTADSQLVTFRWVEGISGPYPYFNTAHQCRDYEALLEWDKKRQPDPDTKEWLNSYGWKPPPDALKLKHAP